MALARTTRTDTVVSGCPIPKGAKVALLFTSANRDERKFPDGESFDIKRDPRDHLGFGGGLHACLGAALARMEVNSFFTELVPRLKSVELNGNPELKATTFVGGLKHLPIRYELR